MRIRRIQSVIVATIMGITAMCLSLWFLNTASPVLAQEPPSANQRPAPNDDDLQFIAFFSQEVPIEVTDLSGTVIGEGLHGGEVRCNEGHCTQSTKLSFTIFYTDFLSSEYEYKFKTRQTIDPDQERVVVVGEGTLGSRNQKERFAFTAIFQNNEDGTISVIYQASRPDASFMISNAPGRFMINSKR